MTRARGLWLGIAAVTILAGCAGPPAPAEPGRCQGDGYSVAVPEGWFAHSGEAEVGVGPCELFAADPFELTRNDNGRWEGVQVSLLTFVGCLGSFETVVEEEAVELDGVAGWRRTMESAEGGGQIGLRAYEYVVAAGPIDCEERRWFIARTESDDPGSFAENSAVLDEMMESVEFDE